MSCWIDKVRGTPLRELLLDFGFLWSNILCYTVGVTFAAVLEFFVLTLINREF